MVTLLPTYITLHCIEKSIPLDQITSATNKQIALWGLDIIQEMRMRLNRLDPEDFCQVDGDLKRISQFEKDICNVLLYPERYLHMYADDAEASYQFYQRMIESDEQLVVA